MRDESNQNCDVIRVRVDGPQGPYLRIATSQVPQVQVLLDSAGLKYTLAEQSDDDCSLTIITFEADIAASNVQQILDELD